MTTRRVYEFSCEVCGKPFTAYRRDKRFCSTACMGRERYRRTAGRTQALKRENVPCQYCGEPFTPKRIDARYCSKVCRSRAYNEANRVAIRERQRLWVENNQEKRKEILANFAERHPDYGKERRARDKADPERREAQRQRAHKHYLANREDYIRRAKERQQAQPTAYYQYRHGRDWDELFAELWQAQDGKCYLCGNPLDREKVRAVHLDHDHSCCKLGYSCAVCRRGLACYNCNACIGHANDDPERLRRIADNLEKANALVRQRREVA